jgi:hypothetical protein
MAWPKHYSGPSLDRLHSIRRTASRLALTTKRPGSDHHEAHRNYCDWFEAVSEAEALLTLEKRGCVRHIGREPGRVAERCDRHTDVDDTVGVSETERGVLLAFVRENPEDADWVVEALAFRRRVAAAVVALRTAGVGVERRAA